MLIYSESFKAEEVCSLNCKHKVTYNDTREVTEIAARTHVIMYEGRQVGNGNLTWWADSDGMIYQRDVEWHGPTGLVDENGQVWHPRPVGLFVNKDLDGNVIDVYVRSV